MNAQAVGADRGSLAALRLGGLRRSANKYVSQDSVGFAYDDSCVSLSIAYTETRNTLIPDRSLTFRLLLRTLAEGYRERQRVVAERRGLIVAADHGFAGLFCLILRR